jgi:hypothetical protein
MHALSLGTWWIHIASVLEWVAAMLAIQSYGRMRGEGGWRWLSLAMLPALVSAMAACTWHLFDNSGEIKGLVVLQAGLTTVGNATLAIAAWNLLRRQDRNLDAARATEPLAAAGPPPGRDQPASPGGAAMTGAEP